MNMDAKKVDASFLLEQKCRTAEGFDATVGDLTRQRGFDATKADRRVEKITNYELRISSFPCAARDCSAGCAASTTRWNPTTDFLNWMRRMGTRIATSWPFSYVGWAPRRKYSWGISDSASTLQLCASRGKNIPGFHAAHGNHRPKQEEPDQRVLIRLFLVKHADPSVTGRAGLMMNPVGATRGGSPSRHPLMGWWLPSLSWCRARWLHCTPE